MCRTAEELFGVYYGIIRNRGYAVGGALVLVIHTMSAVFLGVHR